MCNNCPIMLYDSHAICNPRKRAPGFPQQTTNKLTVIHTINISVWKMTTLLQKKQSEIYGVRVKIVLVLMQDIL